MTAYSEFLATRAQLHEASGFEPLVMPDHLFDFQQSLVEWAVRQGRAALFADCGLGKTPMQLAWAQNVRKHTGKPVLIVTPLAVSFQTEIEAHKFGVDAATSRNGSITADITITNYERLEMFDPGQFGGLVCDESSAIKSFDGVRRAVVTEFMRTFCLGRRYLHRGRLLQAASSGTSRYAYVTVGGRVRRVHTIVLETFVGPRPEGAEGCHNDGNYLNNRLSNLRWDTVSSNRLDTVRHGMHPLVLRTHCPLGHELKAPNLRTKPLPSGRQSRQCLSCARALRRVHYHRKVNGIELDMKILSDAKYAQIMERAA